jgi:hypothetical protein
MILGLAIVVGGMATASAQTQTGYNSIPKPLPGNVASEGPEAYAFRELGDGFTLQGTAAGATLSQDRGHVIVGLPDRELDCK